MKLRVVSFIVLIGLLLPVFGFGAAEAQTAQMRILVVSSYHKEYSWSQETHEGLCAALLDFGYLDNQQQITEFTQNDSVESSQAVVKKMWMDTKRKKSKEEMAQSTKSITDFADAFQPDIILLGDDNAAEYIGGHFLGTSIPIVFWGVNNTPVKYGLVDSEEKPGHNVTGIYQPGFKVESLQFLKRLVPQATSFAVLSDDTTSGRNHMKMLIHLDRKGVLPLKLVKNVSTTDYESWKAQALDLQHKVDAFFLTQYSGLQDKAGKNVPAEEVADWYTTHVTIPEAVDMGQFVKQGMLCGVNDSGYNHGYGAVSIAHDILAKGANPATYPARPPQPGPAMANKRRAKALGIVLTPEMGIEEYVE